MAPAKKALRKPSGKSAKKGAAVRNAKSWKAAGEKATEQQAEEKQKEEDMSVPVINSDDGVLAAEQKALLARQHELFRDKYDHPYKYWWRHNHKTLIGVLIFVAIVAVIIILAKVPSPGNIP